MSSLPSMFATHGLSADWLARLGWVLTAISCAVTVVIIVLLVVAVARRRPAPTGSVEPDGHRTAIDRWIVTGGAIVPAFIIVGALCYTLVVQGAISSPPSPPVATIEVVGHRWWWEVDYDLPTREQRVVTANEMHIPVGRPVRVELTTADVIHSFWVPQLAGKTDLINGQRNVMWIEARTPGTYRGECAEYCGAQHANMDFTVVAEDSATFEAWLSHERSAAATPQDTLAMSGQRVFLDARCPACHAVRGTWAVAGVVGPDLTHLASRTTLGAGLLSNTEGNLAGWVANAPALKPGIVMPPTRLDAAQFRALLAYLETLR